MSIHSEKSLMMAPRNPVTSVSALMSALRELGKVRINKTKILDNYIKVAGKSEQRVTSVDVMAAESVQRKDHRGAESILRDASDINSSTLPHAAVNHLTNNCQRVILDECIQEAVPLADECRHFILDECIQERYLPVQNHGTYESSDVLACPAS